MDEKQSPALKNPQTLYKHAQDLYNSQQIQELEKLFSYSLKKSYDLNLWNLYIEYIKKVSVKKVSITDVYAFVIKHFEFSYFTFSLVKEYISELSNIEDENLRVEKTRKAYHKAFTTPMHNLGVLWSDYEKWEASVNRMASRGFIDQMQPIYSNTFVTYQRLLPFIESDSYFKVIDIEMENPLKLQKKTFEGRLNFVFNFYISKFYDSEALRFLHSFYLKDSVKPERPESTFLSFWYSFFYQKNFFNFDDTQNFDLILINYLNWIVKNEGIEAFRSKVSEVRERMGVQCFIFAANVEFYQGGSKENAYQILMDAFVKFPENEMLSENFLLLFIKIGDEENARLLFKKLSKTVKMWDTMIDYEHLHGDVDTYRSLILGRQEAIKKKEVLKAVAVAPRPVSEGCQGVYETVLNSFKYLDLQIKSNDPMVEFIQKLPVLSAKENIFSGLDVSNLIALLASIN